jgi:hypothetical protein
MMVPSIKASSLMYKFYPFKLVTYSGMLQNPQLTRRRLHSRPPRAALRRRRTPQLQIARPPTLPKRRTHLARRLGPLRRHRNMDATRLLPGLDEPASLQFWRRGHPGRPGPRAVQGHRGDPHDRVKAAGE